MCQQPRPPSWPEAAGAIWLAGLLHGLAVFLPAVETKVAVLEAFGSSSAFVVNGVLEASRAVVAFAAQPALGNLSDAHGRRPLLCWCILFSMLPTLALCLGQVRCYLALSVASGATGVITSLLITSIADGATNDSRAGGIGILLALTYGLAPVVGLGTGALRYVGRQASTVWT